MIFCHVLLLSFSTISIPFHSMPSAVFFPRLTPVTSSIYVPLLKLQLFIIRDYPHPLIPFSLRIQVDGFVAFQGLYPFCRVLNIFRHKKIYEYSVWLYTMPLQQVYRIPDRSYLRFLVTGKTYEPHPFYLRKDLYNIHQLFPVLLLTDP